jgi:hypothetical protein
MSSVAQSPIVTTAEQRPGPATERGHMSREELITLTETSARELLGVSADEAFAMLDRGELEGTLAGDSLQSLRWLLA